MDEEQQVGIDMPFDRRDALRDKVALPECGRVTLDELVPGAAGEPLWAGVDAVLLENVAQRRLADLDAQLLEFAPKPSKTPVVLAGQANDDFARLLRGAGSPTLGHDRCLLAGGDPASEGPDADDGDQMLKGGAHRFAKFDQPLALCRRDSDPRRQLAPQNLVLSLEILDLADELFLGRAGQQEKERLEGGLHGDIVDGGMDRWRALGGDRISEHRRTAA